MLLAPCLRTASGSFSTPGCRAAVPLLGQTLLSHTRRHGRFISQPVLSQGFLDGVFKRGKAHAPELVRLDTDDEGGLAQTSSELFGPLALLMIGFDESEVQIFRSIMLDMDADMVKIIVCDRQMFQGTLCQAMEAPGHMHTQRVGQRAVILSGMNAAEIGEIIGAYRDADLPEPVWAAALAANWDRKVKDLVDDIYGDHNYMVKGSSMASFLHVVRLAQATLGAALTAACILPAVQPDLAAQNILVQHTESAMSEDFVQYADGA